MDRQDFEDFLNEAKQTSGILLTNLRRAADLIRSFKQVAVDQSAETTRPIDLKIYLETTIESLLPELKAGRHAVGNRVPRRNSGRDLSRHHRPDPDQSSCELGASRIRSRTDRRQDPDPGER